MKLVPHRIWVQLSFLLVWLDPLNWRLHSVCGPVFHCHSCPLAAFACPVGVVANFAALHLFPFIALGIIVIVGIFLGSIVCGWLCPFGMLQDLFRRIPAPKFNLPKWAGAFRYVVLVGAVLAVPYFFGTGHPLFVCNFCPVAGLEASVPNMVSQAAAGQGVIWPNLLKLSIIILLLIAVFFVNRPWCRLLCPLGAFFGLFNKISAFFLGFDPDKCTNCNQCRNICEYGIDPVARPNDSRCIRCFECTKCGPGALTVNSILDILKK